MKKSHYLKVWVHCLRQLSQKLFALFQGSTIWGSTNQGITVVDMFSRPIVYFSMYFCNDSGFSCNSGHFEADGWLHYFESQLHFQRSKSESATQLFDWTKKIQENKREFDEIDLENEDICTIISAMMLVSEELIAALKENEKDRMKKPIKIFNYFIKESMLEPKSLPILYGKRLSSKKKTLKAACFMGYMSLTQSKRVFHCTDWKCSKPEYYRKSSLG